MTHPSKVTSPPRNPERFNFVSRKHQGWIGYGSGRMVCDLVKRRPNDIQYHLLNCTCTTLRGVVPGDWSPAQPIYADADAVRVDVVSDEPHLRVLGRHQCCPCASERIHQEPGFEASYGNNTIG